MPVICEKIKNRIWGFFQRRDWLRKLLKIVSQAYTYFFKPKYMFFTKLAEITSVILTLETLVNTVFLSFLHINVLRAHLLRMGCRLYQIVQDSEAHFRSKLKRVVRVWDQNRGLFSNLFRIMSHPPPPPPIRIFWPKINCWCIFGKNRFCGLDAWGVYGNTDIS